MWKKYLLFLCLVIFTGLSKANAHSERGDALDEPDSYTLVLDHINATCFFRALAVIVVVPYENKTTSNFCDSKIGNLVELHVGVSASASKITGTLTQVKLNADLDADLTKVAKIVDITMAALAKYPGLTDRL